MKIDEQIRGYFAAIGKRGGKATSEAKTQAARENAKKGVATICIGGGQGGAMLIENVSEV